MDAIQAMKERRSVRAFKEGAIPRETLEEIMDAARFAPSGWNRQPWVFIVVTDRAALAAIAESARYGKFIESAGACVAVACSESGTALEDACAATENILVAAVARGLGGCWVNSRLKEHTRTVERLLGIPAGWELMSLVALGWPLDESRRDKKPLQDVLRWERF